MLDLELVAPCLGSRCPDDLRLEQDRALRRLLKSASDANQLDSQLRIRRFANR